jgi:hypothetical protein
MLSAEFLAKTQLHAGTDLSQPRRIGKGAQFRSSNQPGILESGTTRTGAGVFASGNALQFAQRNIASGVQPNRFKFFALHIRFLLLQLKSW